MTATFHREYLVHLPMPLAQLYSRAYNAKDPRSQHDHAFYLFEALVKLMAAPLAAAYLYEVRHSGQRADSIDHLLMQLALPSLGQWVGIVRELARHFGTRTEASHHPLGHMWEQLTHRHRDKRGLLGLYQRIKHGPDGERAGDQQCSVLQIFEALVQYRNAVFGHGAPRFTSFYEKEMGPLLLPAVNEVLADDVLAPLGPAGTRLIYLTDLRVLSANMMEIGFRNLVGYQGEGAASVQVSREEAQDLIPHCMAVLWPGQRVPLRLDPLLVYRETELVAEVLFLNRDRNAQQVEYLSYITGRTERDETMAPAMATLLSLIAGQTITEERLVALGEQSVVETPSIEALWELQPEPVRQLGDYEILAEIGRGGMGVVYLARQLALGRIVALKMLPDDLGHDEVALARFQREMRALARCDHPNIIKVLTSGTLPDGRLYYTMEYVPGSDLEQVWRELAGETGQAVASHLSNSTFMRAVLSASGKRRQETEVRYRIGTSSGANRSSTQGLSASADTAVEVSEAEIPVPRLPLPPLPPLPSAEDDPGGYVRCVVTLMRDAALALQAVHDQQITHRDVKPANLILTPDGSRVVLMDFGLAKGPDPTLAASRQGGLLGTMRYAAPEQLAAANLRVGPSADVRGLGVTMWELLTRRRLFADAQDEKQLAMMIHETDVPRLRTIDPSFDRDLEAIVARATERRTADRIPTAGQLAEYLQLYLDHQPLPIRPPSRIELLRRWTRRRKGAVAAGCATAMLLLAGAAGVWYWDMYYRTHVQYYSNFIKRWGAPEGIGRVTHSQVKQRFTTVRFTQQGRRGPVHMVETVDNAGNCFLFHEVGTYLGSGLELDINSIGRKECRWRFEHNDKGQVIKEVALDRASRPVYEFYYPTPEVGVYVVGGIVRSRTGSGADSVRFVRPLEGLYAGLEQELAFIDERGKPKPDARGVYRVKRKFDARGLIIQETYHGLDGTPIRIADNYFRVDQEYNNHGNLVQETYYDEQGRLTRHKKGYTRVIRTYSSPDGWVGSIAAYDEAGNLIDTTDGYARGDVNVDLQSRSVTLSFFDARGNPVAQLQRIPMSKMVLKFDIYGRLGRFDLLDKSDVPISKTFGMGGGKFEYNENGDVVEVIVVDGQGNPTQGPKGYSKSVVKRDKQGNRIEVQTFDVAGQSARGDTGVYRITMQYDAHDNLIEEASFDTADKPMLNNEGYARLRKEYDDHGNVIKEVYYDASDRPLRETEGTTNILKKYDERGNLAEIIYVDEHGSPTLHKNGYARVVQKHDAHGNLIEWACFDADGKSTVDKTGGIHKYVMRYDEQHREVERINFGTNGKPTRYADDGYARYTILYDARGNMIEQAYFDTVGQPTLNKEGYHSFRVRYDERGNQIEGAFFDTARHPTLHKEGNHSFRARYDERGNVIERAFFDTAGQPALHKDGFAKWTNKYDARGNVIEWATFDEAGRPIRSMQGCAKITKQYDARNNQVESVCLDINSTPIANDLGYATFTATFDEPGVMRSFSYTDAHGQPVKPRGRVVVKEVLENRQAQRLGLQVGDVITAYNQIPINATGEFIAAVDAPGDGPRTLVIERAGQTLTFQVQPGKIGVQIGEQVAVRTPSPTDGKPATP